MTETHQSAAITVQKSWSSHRFLEQTVGVVSFLSTL